MLLKNFQRILKLLPLVKIVIQPAIQNKINKIYGVQFHPEVVHTIKGKEILKNFVFQICKAKKHWNMKNFKNEIIESIKKK